MELILTGRSPVKAWVDGVEFEEAARQQVAAMASLPFIHSHIAIMPDVHAGIGATVGSVIPTIGAIVPAAVGVDIGCGMMAQRTSLTASDLPESLTAIRALFERTVPVGFGKHQHIPARVETVWTSELAKRFDRIIAKHPKISDRHPADQLATLGGGNHFIELVLDEEQRVWVILHSGSRGIGNRIGSYFITQAKEEMTRLGIGLVDRDLAYLTENTQSFNDYIEAVGWAQDYAMLNRQIMLERLFAKLRESNLVPTFTLDEKAIACHHNYVGHEYHFGQNVYVTRKGAVRAGKGELGIIPGSMGAKSFIVRGKGNPESFESCSHGAGRRMGRNEAKKRYTTADLEVQTSGVECRKDAGVIDELPAAYKDVDAVMEAQRDLVEIVHTVKQILCVKG
jgi:tRNA-splicing ligase RtcB